MSEEDAERLRISTGDRVEISNGNATISALATVTDRVAAGHVYVSSLLQGGAVAAFYANTAVPTVKLGVPVTA